MSSPYIGEIRMFGGNFAPAGWAFCSGQLVPISENDTLFNLIGTTYGGDGQETFAYPNLNGRVPIHAGQGPGISQSYQVGETGGSESVTITAATTPIHTHTWLGSNNAATSPTPTNSIIGKSTSIDAFVNGTPTTSLNPNIIPPVGGSQPHENMQPYLCVTYIISLFGIFPTQN